MAGCAVVTTRVRQDDGTYREYKSLLYRSDLPSRSFSSEGDDMVSTTFHNVTYFFHKAREVFRRTSTRSAFKVAGLAAGSSDAN